MAVPPGFERSWSNCCHIIILRGAKSRRAASPALLIFTTSWYRPAAGDAKRAAHDRLQAAANLDLGFRMRAGWQLTATYLLLSSAAPLGVRAEVATAKTQDAAPADVAVSSAPRAAQIEPMVAPVKRSAPQTPDNKAKTASGQAGEATAKSGKSFEAVPKKLAAGNAKAPDQEPSTPKSSAKKLAKKNR